MNIKRKAEQEGARPTSWSYLISHKRDIPSSQSLFGHLSVWKPRLWDHTLCVCVHISRDLFWNQNSIVWAVSNTSHVAAAHTGITFQWHRPNRHWEMFWATTWLNDGRTCPQAKHLLLVLTTLSVFYSVQRELSSAQLFHLRDMQISAVYLTESQITLLSHPITVFSVWNNSTAPVQ